jgi:hypothetical protein
VPILVYANWLASLVTGVAAKDAPSPLADEELLPSSSATPDRALDVVFFSIGKAPLRTFPLVALMYDSVVASVSTLSISGLK